jgi:hypothetical protein
MKILFVRCMFTAGVVACVSFSAHAQEDMQRDPTRWSQEDATPQARYATLKKEAAAAYRENTAQCKILPVTERKACMTEAKRLMQDDMARAKEALRQ